MSKKRTENETKRGVKPDWTRIKKAHKLKQIGLSLSEISRAILKREDKKTILRWLNNYEVAKLSTD